MITHYHVRAGAGGASVLDPPGQLVFVIDDDPAVRTSLSWLIKSVGFEVEAFATADEFFSRIRDVRPGCVVLDIRMPGRNGLELLEALRDDPARPPVIVVTGFGDVPMAVRAMKLGAVDFLEKPFNDQALLERIRLAVAQDARRRKELRDHEDILKRLATLTPRERQVLDLVIEGQATKQIAQTLSLSPKTVEVHRSHIMRKMKTEGLAQLVRLTVSVRALLGERCETDETFEDEPQSVGAMA